ncbi:MAG: hypothetical protein QOE64_728 [Frankiales bacterium]|jgi:predicted phosphodiesterase|nr:hypothetical protein [Frankiales bacterium]
MAPERIALISDIHGNVTALNAVLHDIAGRGISRILNLGDVIGKGPRGAEAIEISRSACEATARGNWDSFISRDAVQPFPHAQWTRDQLSSADLDWLSQLPNVLEFCLSGRRIRLFHASQASEFVRVRSSHTELEFRSMFSNTEFTGPFSVHGAPPDATPDVVGYGDIHGSYLKVHEGLMLFNVGAVGNHLDAPSAPYVILEGVTEGPASSPFSVAFVRVDYDIEAEIAIARERGMPDAEAYAMELVAGKYRGDT